MFSAFLQLQIEGENVRNERVFVCLSIRIRLPKDIILYFRNQHQNLSKIARVSNTLHVFCFTLKDEFTRPHSSEHARYCLIHSPENSMLMLDSIAWEIPNRWCFSLLWILIVISKDRIQTSFFALRMGFFPPFAH